MRLAPIQVLASIPVSGSLMMVVLLGGALGAPPGQVGLIVMANGATALVSNYLSGVVADRRGRLLVLRAGLGLSAAGYSALFLARSPADLLLLYAFAGLCQGTYPAALVATGHARHERLGPFLSRTSLGWAIGYSLAFPLSVAAGAQVESAARLVFLLSGASYLAAFLLSLRLPGIPEPHLKVPFFSAAPLRKNWAVYLPFVLRHTGAQAVWVVFPPFLMLGAAQGGLGAPLALVGPIQAVNLFCQAVFMRRIQRWADPALIHAGFLLTAGSFAGYVLAPSWPALLPFQVTIALAWSALWVGSVSTLLKRNEETATVSGIMTSLIAVSHIPGPVAGGLLAELSGFRAAFAFGAGMALGGYLLGRLAERSGRGKG